MNTDLERLHNVFTGKVFGRQCGRSVLLCHTIAGQLEVAPRDIAITFSVLPHAERFIPMLLAVLEEHNIKVKIVNQYTLRVLETGTKISFVARDNPRCLMGSDALVFKEW